MWCSSPPPTPRPTRLRLSQDLGGEGPEALGRALDKLERVVDYCRTTDCLQVHLLRCFGQSSPGHCGHCGNCTCKYVQQDITQEVRLILTAVGHIEERFAFGLGRALARELKALRTAIARELALPAYVIFTNATLADMARRKPQTPEALLQVAGVGMVKSARYGDRFLACIRSWLQKQ